MSPQIVRHLKRFWSRSLAGASQSNPRWVSDNTLLCGLRVGLRETFDYLFQQRPSFAEFESWILEKNAGFISPARIESLNAGLSEPGILGRPADPNAEPALTTADLDFWDRNGYVILHDAVPPENCRAAVRQSASSSSVRLSSLKPGIRGRRVTASGSLLHHPALWANRDSPRIHRAFAQLWNREDVWVNVDQAGFNPPEKPGWKFPGPHLHWDVSLAQPIPFGVQGILYLADIAADQGAFTCVPGFHRKIDSWLESLPAGADPRAQAVPDAAVPIAGRAGDLVIWNQALPHGSSPNRASLPA